ncbi:MAG: acyl-CoA dehydratase activase [Candidatus Acetothermia bacterium]|jgi:predicted CoA-substrate-specific enzyme activase|nr:acyl-CoA dehydratase activase [Candidatus Acetothermia bacterium]MDH7504775.1 acyl-CoA dehydratase activase [Candidatus Acetothermia bacterium]
MSDQFYLGIDVGSVTVKVVALDRHGELLRDYYCRSHGTPLSTVITILDDLFTCLPAELVVGLGTSGSGGELFAQLLGGIHMNELIAQVRAINRFHPEARTVIEIGGQDSKLLILERRGEETVLVDFSLNTQCAAGTGSFLDQQAARLGMSIEEFSKLALESKNPPYIAGRCAVFAKSDIIHLQQVGVETKEIVAGLCLALARNFRSDIGRGREFNRPIVFQGGVSRNPGMVRAFEQVLELEPGELIIPKHQVLMAAIGTALIAKDNHKIAFPWEEKREELARLARAREGREGAHRQLFLRPARRALVLPERSLDGETAVEAYLGIDVGSISTNLVAIDREGRMLGRVYLRTGGDPLLAVRRGLKILDSETGGKLVVIGAGTTGSGRELIGRLVGADLVKNEITAQATAAVVIDPEVDTVFEIGGQDSKFIRLKNGAIIDFAMNKACAAGTGSFLEEQSGRLSIPIERFSEIALRCPAPAPLGERCTVFMESDLIHHQQRGSSKEELVAGLAYSIAYNYLNRVVGNRKIGERILFQGGVAHNKAVLAAFQELTGKEVLVPPHHDVTGAYGMALLVREQMENGNGEGKRTAFRGFDLDRNYEVSHFTCRACANVCEIKQVKFRDGPPLFYGSRCGKFDELQRRRAHPEIPDLFEERERLLWGKNEDYDGLLSYEPRGRKQGRIGVPRALLFWEKLPFWREFFLALGYEVLVSPQTDRELLKASVQGAMALACLPSKVVHGHVKALLEQKLDYLFLPAMIDADFPGLTTQVNHNCPLIQGMPYVANGQFDFASRSIPVIEEPFHFYQPRKLRLELAELGRRLGGRGARVEEAIARAWAAQRAFERGCRKRGQEMLDELGPQRRGVVLLARSYNGCDRGLNLDVPAKLREMGALPIPLDFLPLEEVDWRPFSAVHWNCGKRILCAAEIVKRTPYLHAVYLSHFMCGPDSFIIHHVRHILGDEPLLFLELDEHSGDAGLLTRLEAYLDSLSHVALARAVAPAGVEVE